MKPPACASTGVATPDARTGKASRARAAASFSTNSMASSLHRPRVSNAMTIKRHWVPATRSAYLVSLSLRVGMRSAPFVCAALGFGQASEEVALRRVMSTTNWAPWSIGSPDARTSIALSSSTVTFISLNLTFDRTTAPVSRHILAKVRSVGTALFFNRFERGHAFRWLPNKSNGAPHDHRASVTWIGSLNCSNVSTRNVSGWCWHSQLVGQPSNTVLFQNAT